MKLTFVKTKNVRGFIGLIENLLNKPANIPKMGLIYGEPGLGKSNTALWLSVKYDGIYLRCNNLMTGRWLLEELARELDEFPRYLTSDIFNQCVKRLTEKPQIIIVDEIDYLAEDKKSIETLRDIHDKTGVPIIFVGMGLVNKKLEKYRHLYDRFSEIFKYESFSKSDVKEIIDQLSEVSVLDEAIELIHSKYNRFRQIIGTVNTLERIAKDNSIDIITADMAREVL
jgi:DNA transposition AAA+ family ATPase